MLDMREKVCVVQEHFYLQPFQSYSNLQDRPQATCSWKETEDLIIVYAVESRVFKSHAAKAKWKRCVCLNKGWQSLDTNNSSCMATWTTQEKKDGSFFYQCPSYICFPTVLEMYTETKKKEIFTCISGY